MEPMPTSGDPAGALDRWLAAEPTVATATVSEQDIARFSVAVGATDPCHFDSGAARASGHPAIIAPDTFYLALRTGLSNLVPIEELHEEGTTLRDVPPVEFTTAMAGESDVVLHRPFRAGETVRVTARRERATRKEGRSGPLLLVDFAYDYESVTGEPIATERFTRIFR